MGKGSNVSKSLEKNKTFKAVKIDWNTEKPNIPTKQIFKKISCLLKITNIYYNSSNIAVYK